MLQKHRNKVALTSLVVSLLAIITGVLLLIGDSPVPSKNSLSVNQSVDDVVVGAGTLAEMVITFIMSLIISMGLGITLLGICFKRWSTFTKGWQRLLKLTLSIQIFYLLLVILLVIRLNS